MAIHTWTVNTLNNSDAAFRAWGKGISDALAAVGMVKTADTGQIDWTTVTLPAAATDGGYEVWGFNDALQATYPLFIKLYYGTGNGGRQRLRLAMMKGTNGSGGAVGSFGSTQTSEASGSGSSTVRTWYMSSSGDGVVFQGVSRPDFAFGFAVERSRDAGGAATGAGFLVLSRLNTAGTAVFNYAAQAISPVNTPAGFSPTPIATGGIADGGSAPVFPSLVSDGYGTLWQPRCVMHAMAADVPTLSPITIPGYGTYLPLGQGVWNISDSAFSALIRWS